MYLEIVKLSELQQKALNFFTKNRDFITCKITSKESHISEYTFSISTIYPLSTICLTRLVTVVQQFLLSIYEFVTFYT